MLGWLFFIIILELLLIGGVFWLDQKLGRVQEQVAVQKKPAIRKLKQVSKQARMARKIAQHSERKVDFTFLEKGWKGYLLLVFLQWLASLDPSSGSTDALKPDPDSPKLIPASTSQ